MARIRSIHPGQWTDEDFAELSMAARLLCLSIRCEADDYGAFEWKPKRLKMRLFPADSVDMEELLQELIDFNQVKKYEVCGKQYGLIRNFCQFQRPRKPVSFCPIPSELQQYCGLSNTITELEPVKDSPVPQKSVPVPQKSEFVPQKEGRKEGRKVLNPPTPLSWGDFKNLYPDRKGQVKYLDKAEVKYRALLAEGEDPKTIIAGLTGYIASIRGKDILPKTATVFLDNRLYLEYLPEADNAQPLIAAGVDGSGWAELLERWPNQGQAKAWLYPFMLESIRDGTATLSTKSQFLADTFRRDYAKQVLDRWTDITRVDVQVISQVREVTA